MLWISPAVFVLGQLLVLNAAEDSSEIPPSDQWISVDSVNAEYLHVRRQRSPAGGRFEVISQSTGVIDDRHYDQLVCKCRLTGKIAEFTFDVTSIYRRRELEKSKKAREQAFQCLAQEYPKISEETLPELKALLTNKNPHYRTWSIERLAALKTAASDEILLNAFHSAGLLESWRYDQALAARGDKILPLIERLLVDAKPEIPWDLLGLLGDIRTSRSARTLERQLEFALKNNPRDIRVCCISLGSVGKRSSEKILLRALAAQMPAPDDSIIWALGFCGSKAVVPHVEKLLKSEDEDARLAAIAALGNLGVRSSIPFLLETAATGKSHNERHNAIYALGQLQATEAVPLLIKRLHEKRKYVSYYSPTGLFGRRVGAWSGNHIGSSIKALARIGDRRALPEFRRILKDDRYYLNDVQAANAAAELNWKELVPEILERFEEKYEDNVSLFGTDREFFSPALRKLTGQSFGEDPTTWRKWFDERADNLKSANTSDSSP